MGVPFNNYLRKELASIRSDFRYHDIAIWTYSELGASSDDVFYAPTSISSGSRLFSGAVAWNPILGYEDTAGGVVRKSDCAIVASNTEKNYVDAENVYLVANGVSLRPLKIVEVTETEEIVIHCERVKT